MPKQTNSEQASTQAARGPQCSLRRCKAEKVNLPMPTEDARITAGAVDDPDNPPLPADAMAGFTPATPAPRHSSLPASKGRRQGCHHDFGTSEPAVDLSYASGGDHA